MGRKESNQKNKTKNSPCKKAPFNEVGIVCLSFKDILSCPILPCKKAPFNEVGIVCFSLKTYIPVQ